MAFKLSKAQQKTIDDHIETLKKKRAVVQEAESARTEAISALDATVQDALRDYNGALANAKSFVESTAEEFRSAFDEKSERWQEGDAGSDASTFVEAWEEVSLEEHDDQDTVAPDEQELDADIDALEALPTEAGG